MPDICSIFSNIIDNAIEACIKIMTQVYKKRLN
ncbi:GHKL domain-containing protein [Clostridioides difficile]